ncbi:MAG: acetolactate synthase small subunit [Candidatus Omnitrophota bacterium]|nr:MAG: acetolactate synthase small subunit [Candidatus Omnitrophota bacterium]
MRKFTLSVLVENKFGVLARIAGLFSARGFNINSLAVAETEDPRVSRMTMVVDADEKTLEQIKKQLNKLIDVIKVIDLTKKDYIDRELVLIKVKISAKTRDKVVQAVDSLNARVVDMGKDSLTVEEVGDMKKINATLELLGPFGIAEIVRTGRIAIQAEKKGVI